MMKLNKTCPHCGQECTREDWEQMNEIMSHDAAGQPFFQHFTCLRKVHDAEHAAAASKTCPFCDFPDLAGQLTRLGLPGG